MKTNHKELTTHFARPGVAILFALSTAGFLGKTARADKTQFKTVAESSGYKATSRSVQVSRFIRRVTRSANQLNQVRFGRTVEGRPLVAVVANDPPMSRPAESAADNRLVVFVLGNIHSGECAGKEALLALLRDVAHGKFQQWFQHLVVVTIPNFNADGNDRISTDHRKRHKRPYAGSRHSPECSTSRPESRLCQTRITRSASAVDNGISITSQPTDKSQHL